VSIISLAAETDWRAAAFYLERTAPERWGRRDRIEHQGRVTATHEGSVAVGAVSDDALAAAIGSDPEAAGCFAGLLQRAARCAAAIEPSPRVPPEPTDASR
jgi:hypothetical protein